MTRAAAGDAVPFGDRLRGHVAMLVYAGLVAGSFSYGALAAPHIGASSLTAARFLLASVLMGALLAALGRRMPRRPPAPWRFVVLGALMGVFFVLMFVALNVTDPVSTGAVFTLIPLMSAFFGYVFLRQRTRPLVGFSLVLSAAGALWVIFGGDVAKMTAFDVGRGEAIFFVGCVCQAAYGPLVRLFNRGETALESSFWTIAAATVCLVLFAAPELVRTDWAALPAVVWECLAYLTVFSTAATFFLLQYASLRLPAAKVFAYSYLVPSVIIVLEGLLGHGWSSLAVAAGALVTVAGLVVLVVSPDG